MLKERAFDKIKEIEENLAVIDDNLPDSEQEFENLGLIKDGIYKRLEHCIENIIDITYMIYSSLNPGIPSDEDSVIEKLKKEEVISQKASQLIKDMKGMRNILVHRYGEIDDELIFTELTQNISDFDIIIKEFTVFLKD